MTKNAFIILAAFRMDTSSDFRAPSDFTIIDGLISSTTLTLVMIKSGKILMLLVSLLVAGMTLSAQEMEIENVHKPLFLERETWRFEFDNDVFFGSDNGISSGQSLQRHSAAAADWEDLEGVLKAQRRLGHLLSFPKGRDMLCRAGLAIGQLMQTPDDLKRRDLIPEDVPYAGALTLQANWYVYSDKEFRGFEIMAGIAGPLSLAGANQKMVHKLFDFTVPQGWDNQLGNELLVNFNVVLKRKLWRAGRTGGTAVDLTVNSDAALGNLFTHASAGLELRAGYNMPGGFISLPDPIGFSMHHAAFLNPVRPAKPSLQWILVLRGTALVRMLFLDGNTFQNSHHVERNFFVAQVMTGLRLEMGRWGIGFFVMRSSPLVKAGNAPSVEERERLGTIHIELRF